MPKFIVDECTGIAVTHFLREQGFDTVSVSEESPQTSDLDILHRAIAEQRIVVTNDKDFGDMVYRDNHHHCGVLLLRLADDRVATKIRVIAAVLKQHLDKLQEHFVVATEQNIRIRSSRS
jgi:predicted nuclease of predicted toxin-antitoxin system